MGRQCGCSATFTPTVWLSISASLHDAQLQLKTCRRLWHPMLRWSMLPQLAQQRDASTTLQISLLIICYWMLLQHCCRTAATQLHTSHLDKHVKAVAVATTTRSKELRDEEAGWSLLTSWSRLPLHVLCFELKLRCKIAGPSPAAWERGVPSLGLGLGTQQHSAGLSDHALANLDDLDFTADYEGLGFAAPVRITGDNPGAIAKQAFVNFVSFWCSMLSSSRQTK